MLEYITRIDQVGSFQKKLIISQLAYLDTETTGLDPFSSIWLLLQVRIADTIFVFDVRLLGEKLIKYIISLLKESNALIHGHNLKFDLKVIKQNTGVLLENVFDTQIAEILITNGLALGRDRYPSLEDLASKYLNVQLDKTTRETFIDYTGPITQQQIDYAAKDVAWLEQIATLQEIKIIEQGQYKVLGLENRLVPVIAQMELNGVSLDREKWDQVALTAEGERSTLEFCLKKDIITFILNARKFNNGLEAVDALKIFGAKKLPKKTVETLTGLAPEYIQDYLIENFNLNSNAQILNVLNNFYGIPVTSTNETIIDKFQNDFPIIAQLISYREKQKQVSSFGTNFYKHINPKTGRIHCNVNQIGAQSGRCSSNDPNMYNIPKDNLYRNSFVARNGYKIVGADYSQEELRLMAALSGDPTMTQAFLDDADIHTRTAARIFGKEDTEVSQKERSRGKNVNFTVGYDGTEYALYKRYGIPMEEGKQLIKDFYQKAYPILRTVKDALGNKILEYGFAKTPLGRKRFFERKILYADIYEKRREEERIKREGCNHMLGQGPGADIIKGALVRMHYENPFGEDNFKIIIQVYDEIVCEVKEELVEEASLFIKKVMIEEEEQYLKNVPAKVELTVDNFWRK
jgi:DNA polymerase I